MSTEDQTPDNEDVNQGESEVLGSSVFRNDSDALESTPPEAQGEEGEPSGSLGDILDSANESSEQEVFTATVVPKPSPALWESAPQSDVVKPYEPYMRSTLVAKVLLAVASVVSAFMFFVFLVQKAIESGEERVLTLSSLWILLVALILGIEAFRIRKKYVPNDVRNFAFFALLVAVCCAASSIRQTLDGWGYFFWVVTIIAAVVPIYFAPRPRLDQEEIKFDVDDSIAANGGAVTSLALGLWALFGSLFTNLSVINAFLGIALGLWGLTSRKKMVATVGIVLCIVGVMACMLNVTAEVWQFIRPPESDAYELTP